VVVAAPLPLAHLTPWPDTAGALSRLKESGIRIITIANFSPTLLRSNAENAGLIGFFDSLVSTDANHTYKPDPRAYRLDKDRLHLKKSDMLALHLFHAAARNISARRSVPFTRAR
jgi:HAD superfamily hydrolase (TIGR01493 family)